MRSSTSRHFLVLLVAVAAGTTACNATGLFGWLGGHTDVGGGNMDTGSGWNIFGGGQKVETKLWTWGQWHPVDNYQCPIGTCNSCNSQAGVQFGGTPMATLLFSSSTPETESAQCCQACKSTIGCHYWQLERNFGWDAWKAWDSWAMNASPKCTLYRECTNSAGVGGWCGFLDNDKWMTSWGKQTWGGGLCQSEIKNDPHLLGAQGTQYDFNGVPDETFCLISDKKYAINMLLTGYYDKDATGATVLETTAGGDGKKGVRTWIRELAFVWTAADGSKHTLRMAARPGTESGVKRGPGFMKAIELDGAEIPTLQEPGHSYYAHGAGVNITMLPYETHGPMDIDVYDVNIDGVLAVTLRLRAAIPKFQLKNDAGEVIDTEVHINLEVRTLHNSPDIHGVLGQTYRADHTERANLFKKKVKELGGPIQADGETGKGFLDGEPMDYRLEHLFATSWKFSAFEE